MASYESLIGRPDIAPPAWEDACTHSESTLHQLSPYIGKLKSKIAHDLIAEYSNKGDLVADVFCGSGTVPLECVQMGRRVYASDASLYAITLTKGKLAAPADLETAYSALDRAVKAARSYSVDLRRVPKWVRAFYHPKTLKEILSLLEILRSRREYFLLACLLGIAHHQRPGFLSYPSSHLVPYLRSKKFPQDEFPEMYEYRRVKPRIKAKIARALKRRTAFNKDLIIDVRRSTIEHLTLPPTVECFITSPPYMNALDYGRDNRLRNWFLNRDVEEKIDVSLSRAEGFRHIMVAYARSVARRLTIGGYCIFVVGEKAERSGNQFPSEVVSEVIDEFAPTLKIQEIIFDKIPDIRRSRRHHTGVKMEHILVYQQIS